MHIHKVPLLEKLVDGIGDEAAHTEYRLERICAGAQVGHCPQILQGMALLLQGILRGGSALHRNAVRLDLKGLLGLGGFHQGTGDDQRRADICFGDLLEIVHIVVVYHLDGIKESTVVQDDEAKLLAGADGTHPAAHLHGFACVGGGVLKQFTNGNQFHRKFLSC